MSEDKVTLKAEGSGKTTVLNLVAEYFKSLNYSVEHNRDEHSLSIYLKK